MLKSGGSVICRRLALALIPLLVNAASFGAGAAANAPKSLSEDFEGLQFRSIGPYRGGRSVAVTGVRGQPLTFLFGGTGGGVWKTVDGGSNWEVLSDKDFKTGSVGAIAVAESDPNVLYAGMGESPIRGNVSHGDGVYKSTDGGRSWQNVGLTSSRQIARVRIHPKNPDLVYVAVFGHVWGPNEERGVFRSSDGGKSWKRILFVDDKTGASDLAMDPNNPRILYAGFWEAYRRPWTLSSGGPGGGIFKTTDGGDTWKKLKNGLPEGIVGRVGVAPSASRPGLVWAVVEAEKGGLFRSDDGGEKWTRVNGEHKIRQRAWYYSWVYPDPKNAETLYLPNVDLHKSIDGGKTFANLPVPHGDNHDMWIDPDDSSHLIVGNDGGATITFNGGKSWSTQLNQPTAQFYRVATDNRYPYWVYGSQQDNSNVAMPSGVPGVGMDITDWHAAGGGESGWMAPNWSDPEIVYAGEYGGQITRYDHRTHQVREVGAWPQLADGHAASDLKYRFQWNAPILVSRHDPKVLYHASQVLLRSTDEGETWTEVSPDLTRNDRSKQGPSGGPITRDMTGVEVYDTIFALSESPLDQDTIWAGSDDGLVHVTRDGGKNWQNVTPKGMPEWIQINAIDPSPHDAGTAYVAATMYKWDDFRPYLYKTTDYGKTWTKIDSGIPDGAFTRVVREDTIRRGLLYAGTETGLYLSFDGGATWRPFQRNLPATPITDLAQKNDDLVVATQGRGFWILDDVAPLRQWNGTIGGSDIYLFAPQPAVRFPVEKADEEDVVSIPYGKNLPGGLVIDYWLKNKPTEKDKISIDILSEGKVIRSFSNEKKEKPTEDKELLAAASPEEEKDKEKPLEPTAGVNRFIWDLRILKPTLAPKTVFNEGGKEPPRVAPGTYEVRLKVNDKTFTQKAEVRPNPEVKVGVADLRRQFELLSAIRDSLSETHETVVKIRDIRSQVNSIADHAEKAGKGTALKTPAKNLSAKLTAVEEKLTNPKITANEDDLNYEPKLDHDFVWLAAIVSSADAKPLSSSEEYYKILRGRLAEILKEYQAVVDGDLAEYNRAVLAEKIPPVEVPTQIRADGASPAE
jgi:photosystem II stability/assembly factor-like uncharacterized protein